MKKSLLVVLSLVVMLTAALFSTQTASAVTEHTEGYLKYIVSNGEAEITDCDTSVSGKLEIPSRLGGYPVTKIGANSFVECVNLTSVTIPNGITTIGVSAFVRCSSMESIVIPRTVTIIGSYAFSGCSKLTEVRYKGSEDTWNYVVFIANDNYPIYQATKIYDYKELTDYFTFTVTNNEATIASVDTSISGDITIPSTLGGYPVTTIGIQAFLNCTGLTSISLPNSVAFVGNRAFESCTFLTSVTIPNSVTSIGDYAFKKCDILENVYYPCCEITWNKISIGSNNEDLIGAKKIYADVKEVTDLKYLVSNATCSAKAVYNKSCSVCEAKLEETFEYGTVADHKSCEKVNEIYLISKATCIAKAKYSKSCEWCGIGMIGTFEYGAYADHIPTEKVDEKYLLSPATPTEKAIYKKSCSVCGVIVPGVFTHGNPLVVKEGWQYEDNTWYFYENGVKVTNGWRIDSTGWCFLDKEGKWVTNGLVQDSVGLAYITENGYFYYNTTGWKIVNNEWYYIENGYAVTNQWRADSTGWCYLSETGAMVTNGFVEDSVGLAYITKDGYFYETENGWRLVNNEWYFVEKGYAVTNVWRKDSNGWCYLSSTGGMVTNGFVKDSVGLAYVTKDGYFYETENGWRLVDNKWYFIEGGYAVKNQWRLDSIGWCYLTSTGAMVTNGWVKDSIGWCYLDESGYWNGVYHNTPAT